MPRFGPLLLALSVLTLAGCELLSFRSSASTRAASLGEPFEVGFGETVAIRGAGLEVRFTGVDDSRCPQDVQCVRAGEASAAFALAADGAEENAVLRLPPLDEAPDAAIFGGYRVRLLELLPLPHSERPSSDRLYRATLLVEPVDAR